MIKDQILGGIGSDKRGTFRKVQRDHFSFRNSEEAKCNWCLFLSLRWHGQGDNRSWDPSQPNLMHM